MITERKRRENWKERENEEMTRDLRTRETRKRKPAISYLLILLRIRLLALKTLIKKQCRPTLLVLPVTRPLSKSRP
jgi:hypothetical protein